MERELGVGLSRLILLPFGFVGSIRRPSRPIEGYAFPSSPLAVGRATLAPSSSSLGSSTSSYFAPRPTSALFLPNAPSRCTRRSTSSTFFLLLPTFLTTKPVSCPSSLAISERAMHFHSAGQRLVCWRIGAPSALVMILPSLSTISILASREYSISRRLTSSSSVLHSAKDLGIDAEVAVGAVRTGSARAR